MNRKFTQHIAASVLLLYLCVGFLGSLEVISNLFRPPTPVTSFRVSKPLPPTSCKIIWTQYKHIPSSPKVVVQTQAILTDPISIERKEFSTLVIPFQVSGYTSPQHSSGSSRAPPSA
ncbi:MAG: hypothetical protein V1799_05775 [bacterium]